MKEDFKELDNKLSALTDIQEPKRDLWPEISNKITHRDKSRNSGRFSVNVRVPLSMAAGAAIMFLGLLLGLRLSHYPSDKGSFSHQIISLEKEYQRVRPLSFSAVRSGTALPSDSLDLIEAELNNLDKTTLILLELLEAHPNDPLIYQKIAELYEQKFQVLREMNQKTEERDSI